jgi:hypothetical protein
MRKIEMKGRMPGPALPDVVRELVDRLVSDDWCRFSTEDENRYYYEIGFEACEAGRSGNADFRILEWPVPEQLSPLSEWYVRSQLASKHPPYLQQARKQLEHAGVDPDAVDRWIDSETNRPDFKFRPDIPKEKRLELLSQYLQAERVYDASRNRPFQLDEERKGTIERGRQKLYLQELCNKFAEMVDRGGELEPLYFRDVQLEEASKCYLFGFLRASVVLAAAAVESHLKRATGIDKFKYYEQLVDTAFMGGLLTSALSTAAKHIFDTRNTIVHKNGDARECAAEILSLAREVVDHLVQTVQD